MQDNLFLFSSFRYRKFRHEDSAHCLAKKQRTRLKMRGQKCAPSLVGDALDVASTTMRAVDHRFHSNTPVRPMHSNSQSKTNLDLDL
jgi:hypothetical protein